RRALQLHGERRRAADFDEARAVLPHIAVGGQIFTRLLKDAGGVLVGWGDYPVMHPLPFPPDLHDARPAQVGEMPRNPRLRHLQDFDEEAYADLVVSHEIDQPEAVAVGKRHEEFFEVEFSVGSAHNVDIVSQHTFALTNIYCAATLISRLRMSAEKERRLMN